MKLMHKEKIFTIIVSSFLIWMLSSLHLAIITKAQPQEVVVGVKVHDWVRYGNILAEWNSTQLNPDPEFVEQNNTLWFKNEVLNIVDTHIVFNQTTYFKNGTPKTSKFTVDIYTGQGSGSLMFVPSGLSPKYYIYPASPAPVWINGTTTRTYAGATREVNYLDLTGTQTTEDDPPNIIRFSISYYWDKETGVLTERVGNGIITDHAGSQIASWTRSDKIVKTNLWSPEEKPSDEQDGGANQFQYAAVGAATVTLILIGIWMLWPRKRRLKKRKSRIRH